MNHPYLDPSFLVSWSRLTPDAIKPDVMEAIARARANIQAICDQPLDSLTYESTFGALEKPLRNCTSAGAASCIWTPSMTNLPSGKPSGKCCRKWSPSPPPFR